MSKATSGTERIDSVQVLRALAAFVVAFGHAMGSVRKVLQHHGSDLHEWANPAGLGVDIFFVISGFIMVYASERMFGQKGARAEFLYRRLARIVPLYWGTTAFFVILLAIDAWHGGEFPSFKALATSFLFVPSYAFKPVDGQPFPIVSNGWTLNHEMYFYAVFSIFIFLRRDLAALATATAIAGIIFLTAVFHPANTILQFWGRGINLEFVFGIGIAVLKRRNVTLPDWLRVALIAVAVIWFVIMVKFPPPGVPSYEMARIFAWGLPACLLLAATVLGQDPLPRMLERPIAVLGDASYSFYLIHPVVYVIFQHSGFYIPGVVPAWIEVFLLLATACGVSILVNQWIEQPLLKLLQRYRPGRRPVPVAA